MSISFSIPDKIAFREFTVDDSEAIASILVYQDSVTIAFQTNPERQYFYRGSDRFIPHIRAMVANFNPLVHSMGTTIAKARKSGDLEIVKDF